MNKSQTETRLGIGLHLGHEKPSPIKYITLLIAITTVFWFAVTVAIGAL